MACVDHQGFGLCCYLFALDESLESPRKQNVLQERKEYEAVALLKT